MMFSLEVRPGRAHATDRYSDMTRRVNTSPVSGPLLLQLAVHRMKKGVTLEQIAEATKISRPFLRAIEAEEFEKLPGGIFSRSYIRQYAAAVCFDEEELLACYRSRMGRSDDHRSQPDSRPFRQQPAGKRSGFGWFRVLSPLRYL
jgi:cytoskeletal protein RodZ